jgi:hypothetical protein
VRRAISHPPKLACFHLGALAEVAPEMLDITEQPRLDHTSVVDLTGVIDVGRHEDSVVESSILNQSTPPTERGFNLSGAFLRRLLALMLPWHEAHVGVESSASL